MDALAEGSVPDGGNLDGTVVPDAEVPDRDVVVPCDVQTVFDRSCAVSGCHDAVTQVVNLDLSNVGSGAQFVGREPSPDMGACGGAGLLIDRDFFEDSLFIDKVASNPPVCGNRMPLAGTSLSTDDLNCIFDWVVAAARL